MAPNLEATTLWLRQAGAFRAADEGVQAVPGAVGWGPRGWESSMEGGDVSSSQTKLPSLSWLICISLCIHLHATFWKGLTFNCCLSPIFRGSAY